MTGPSILHCRVPEHPTSENDSRDLLHIYDGGRNEKVPQRSNANDHMRDGEAGSDSQSSQDEEEEETKGTDDQVIVSSIRVLHNSRLRIHVSFDSSLQLRTLSVIVTILDNTHHISNPPILHPPSFVALLLCSISYLQSDCCVPFVNSFIRF